MADGRDPDAIQREIEQTRTELASAIDAIADRLSPKRAATRGANRMRAGVQAVLGREESPDGHRRSGAALPARVSEGLRGIASGDGSHPISRGEGAVGHLLERNLRTDRVLIAVGVTAAVTALIILRRSRNRDQ